MAEPFIGEIRMFGGNFAPRSWAFCDGALMSISQNDALYALIGTTYGGDGQTSFGLPDLRGRLPIHQGQGQGLSPYVLGQSAGSEYVTLTQNQMPQHTHPVQATSADSTLKTPVNGELATGANNSYFNGFFDVTMKADMVSPAGGNQPHNNMMPYLVLSFIIALEGVFPSQS